MSINVLQAGRYMAGRSGWTLSNLELQKILYIAHMFHLGRHGTALVGGEFQAWDLGPVHPILYRKVKRFGADPVTEIDFPGNIEEGTAKDLLSEAVDELSGKTGAQLVAITHWEDGAWAKNYIPGVRGRIIPTEDIIDEYRHREAAAAAKTR